MKRKLYSFFTLVCALIFTACLFVCCQKEEGGVKATVAQTTENLVVIQVDEVDGEATLLSVMESLQEKGELQFVISGGMVTEINGKINATDFSYCWMLYTSDTEFSSTEFGSVAYNGKTYGQASKGASDLLVKEGEYYIWAYEAWRY